MPNSRSRDALVCRSGAPLAVALCLALALSACSGNSSGGAATDAPSRTPAAVNTPDTAKDSPATTTPKPSPGLPADALIAERLLPLEQVPTLDDGSTWQETATGPAGEEPFGACAVADLSSIGAVDVVERTWGTAADSGDSAGQQIAEFADTTSTAQAVSVLRAWFKKCTRHLSGRHPSVAQQITPVDGTAGAAFWYIIGWQPDSGMDNDRVFESFGVAAVGQRITVLRLDDSATARGYDGALPPMPELVRAAAARLG